MKPTLVIAIGILALGTGLAQARGVGQMNLPSFDQLDSDASGTVSLEDFQVQLRAWAEQRGTPRRAERNPRGDWGAAMFSRIDANDDGVIDADEYAAFIESGRTRMQQRGQRRMGDWGAAMFSRIDANGDGVIDADEYAAFIESRSARMEKRGQRRWGKTPRD